jgi:hypothetical protein
MKGLSTILFLLIVYCFASCEEKMPSRSETECVKVRFIMDYCPATEPLHLVEILSPSSLATKSGDDVNPSYTAALLDLPASMQVRDTIFYMQVHRDPVRESRVTLNFCPAIFGPNNILVCEGIVQQPCVE